MTRTWRSTALGKVFTSTKPWSLSLDADRFALEIEGRQHTGSVLLLDGLTVKPGVLWASVRIEGINGQQRLLDGIANRDATQMRQEIAAAVAVVRRQQQIAAALSEFEPAVKSVQAWVADAKRACDQELRSRGWLGHEFQNRWASTKPQGLGKLLLMPEFEEHLSRQSDLVKGSVALWRRSFAEVADGINKRHVAKELVDSRAFFDQVEKSPLTQEQAEAVLCFDNRVLLVASAGSGKTSTMVAKAGYALKQNYFAPDRMLLLAFNNDAAAELRARIAERLEPLGLPADKVVAKTFHAFGLDVIGAATGKKPSLAPWVESGRDLETLLEMVDELKDADLAFRAAWDLFRLVFGQDLPKFGEEETNPDAWDRASERNGFWTLQGEVVKSRGELVIANWLFYNGVQYVYEAEYKVDTADPTHRQYRPDFYLPGPDAYLEHWAIDANGEPPPTFVGYKEGMAWKRQVHAQNGTKLLETTMAELWSGSAFEHLKKELTKLGVELDPNPDRGVTGRQPIESPRLARTIRAFLTHAKSNRLTVADLRQRLDAGAAGQFRFRHDMFLSIFEKLRERWETRLRADRCIDFEDMLNMAADCVEQGRWDSPYELVMVDEFQDASMARARLVSSLISKPGRHLFAVGDDWQSINRFAGADLSVMTEFESKFGKAVTLKLETTFRCPQALCDISSQFVQKNPSQIPKTVRSPKRDSALPVRIVSVRDEAQIRLAIETRLAEIASENVNGDHPTKVYLLGRYRRDADHAPRAFDRARVEVEFMTVHSSKGLEADHVILPRMTSEGLGFPSGIADDPVLRLAMPDGDGFAFSEERRLFYVALTRARQTVTLVTVAGKESPFIFELMRDFNLKVQSADGTLYTDGLCSTCGAGFMVQRTSRYGRFLGCSTFPRCKGKQKL